MIRKYFHSRFALFTVAGAAIAAACLLAFAPQKTTLHFIHTNDLHAHLIPWHQNNAACTSDEPACRGGFAQVKTIVEAERQKHPDALLFDVGDRFSGTVFYTFRKGRDILTTLSPFKYDAIIPGNHEFDNGLEELSTFVTQFPAPFIATNIDFDVQNPLYAHTKNHVIFNRNGVNIGVIGAVTEDVKKETKGGADLPIMPVIPALCQEAQTLKENGIHIIVALTHIGLPRDKQLAQDCPDIDIIIGGHTHALLSNDPNETKAVDRYPILIQHDNGTQTAIVTAGIGGHHVGSLTAEFDKNGHLTAATGDTIPVTPDTKPDADVQAQIKTAQKTLADLLNTPLTTVDTAFPLTPGQHFCSENCAVGDVLADLALSTDPDADIAILNSGGIRSGLPGGTITVEHLAQAYPFDSELVTIHMTGREVIETIKRGVSKYISTDRTNTLAIVAGLSYTFNGDTQTVTRIQTPTGDINPDKTYAVVIPSFLAQGGDDFIKKEPIRVLAPSVRDALIAQIQIHTPARNAPRIVKENAQ